MSEPTPTDAELVAISKEEEACLAKVLHHLDRRRQPSVEDRAPVDYDAELLSLRDQMSSARTEDLPPLIEQMERLQALANRQTEVEEATVDPRSPYFGRLVLEENGKTVTGRAADTDTLVASAKAYLNALNKLLVKRQKTAPEAMSASH